MTWPARQVGGVLSCALELALGEDDGGASSFTNPGRAVPVLGTPPPSLLLPVHVSLLYTHSLLLLVALRYIEENVDAEERALGASFGAGECPPPPSTFRANVSEPARGGVRLVRKEGRDVST